MIVCDFFSWPFPIYCWFMDSLFREHAMLRSFTFIIANQNEVPFLRQQLHFGTINNCLCYHSIYWTQLSGGHKSQCHIFLPTDVCILPGNEWSAISSTVDHILSELFVWPVFIILLLCSMSFGFAHQLKSGLHFIRFFLFTPPLSDIFVSLYTILFDFHF